ncbi:hypothetical protein NBH00_04810 [Paraconexibacter antarcticus]|uniref:Uncharacterized protein n=1 Tax=Paraconexibacter antarcticus TaxID=2949664 RepID=A0ABY5DXC5_9ACTN|nr:hypothetical protein [Paraconexibacter antarcticus]UTI65537.1 hypothetical protein NBH00_04810 [Paraconexibacter antarcticus]
MWFGILTPGAHPSRPVPTVDDATVFCWTPRERARIDGPAFAVHGGLRTLRRSHQEAAAGLPPRCFACREPCLVPDADALRADGAVPTYAGRPGDPGGPREEHEAIAALADAMDRGPAAPRRAVLAFVHLEDLAGTADPPVDEEALVVIPERRVALFVPLFAVPELLTLAARVPPTGPPGPECERCGRLLPGSVHESEAPVRARSSRRRGRRAA